MKIIESFSILLAAFSLTACSDPFGSSTAVDKTVDQGIDAHHLREMKAGIWVDPLGCDHWIIDDGVEGYLSARLDSKGKPVCSGTAEPTTIVGDFKHDVTGDPI